MLDLTSFSWDSFLLKCLRGLCQTGNTIHMWIQHLLGSKSLILIELNRSEHPMDYKSAPEKYPPSGENQRLTRLVWEGESWISASVSNTTKSCVQKIITMRLYGQIMSRTLSVPQNSQTKMWNKQDHFKNTLQVWDRPFKQYTQTNNTSIKMLYCILSSTHQKFSRILYLMYIYI